MSLVSKSFVAEREGGNYNSTRALSYRSQKAGKEGSTATLEERQPIWSIPRPLGVDISDRVKETLRGISKSNNSFLNWCHLVNRLIGPEVLGSGLVIRSRQHRSAAASQRIFDRWGIIDTETDLLKKCRRLRLSGRRTPMWESPGNQERRRRWADLLRAAALEWGRSYRERVASSCCRT